MVACYLTRRLSPRISYIPLQFFCCRYNGLALPLIALQYHEVRFDVLLKNYEKLIIKQGDSNISSDDVSPTITLDDVTLLINYIYLQALLHGARGKRQ